MRQWGLRNRYVQATCASFVKTGAVCPLVCRLVCPLCGDSYVID
jgi:hypothetical protein